MKKILQWSLVVIMVSMTTVVFAQKFGHINTQELLNAMPEKETAQKQIQEKAAEFDKTLKDLQSEYQKLVGEYLKGVEDKTLVDPAKSEKEKDLEELQKRIKTFDQHATEELQKMQNQLLNPIITKARAAINEVAAENGYTYIFDLSAGGIVYTSTGSDNILKLVKDKLGL